MPKKIFFESARHQILTAARNMGEKRFKTSSEQYKNWITFLNSLTFKHIKGRKLEIQWANGTMEVDTTGATLYLRGDADQYVNEQKKIGLASGEDRIQVENDKFFTTTITNLAKQAGIQI